MIKRSAFAALSLALSVLASPAAATEWEYVDWNGTQVWGAEWTPNTQLQFNAQVGSWYKIYFEGATEDYMNGNQVLPGLAATVMYRLSAVNTAQTQWTFDYVVENASNQWVDESRVSAIGFDVYPDVKNSGGVTLYSGGEYRTVGKGKSEVADDKFDVCFLSKSSSSSNNCDGGSYGGPEVGEIGTGSFRLNFKYGTDSLIFTNPFVEYADIEYDVPRTQTSKYGSYYDNNYGYGHHHSPGCGHDEDSKGVGIPVAWVPEPSTWAMMILGLGASGAMLRRRRSAVA